MHEALVGITALRKGETESNGNKGVLQSNQTPDRSLMIKYSLF